MSIDLRHCHWLCAIGVPEHGWVPLKVRTFARSFLRREAFWIRVSVQDFYDRVCRAFHIVVRFWLGQIRQGIQCLCLLPVPVGVMSAASWLLNRDLGASGAFLLRSYLGEVLGRFRDTKLSDVEIVSAMRRRELPSLCELSSYYANE